MTDETTREKVRALVKAEPNLNLSGIAKRIGVSRERVRQIAADEGLSSAKGVVGVRLRTGQSAPPPTSRVITGGVPVKISHTVAGTIGELLVAADLSARGRIVFFPLVRTAACDLISLDRNGTVERIEVRCGKRTRDGRVTFSTVDQSKSDRRAIVMTGEPVVYRPSLD